VIAVVVALALGAGGVFGPAWIEASALVVLLAAVAFSARR
jgi:hypothetical protein